MPKRPKHLRQSAWDALNPRYANLDNPEWVTMSRLPAFFWEDEHNHRRYITWMARQLGIGRLDDWYQLTLDDFHQRRGHGFLEYYGSSVVRILQVHFPQHDWKPWLFRRATAGYWNELQNCRKYVHWFEQQFGIRGREDWYRVTQDDIFAHRGSGLMDHFECSVQQLLAYVYPDYDWKPWLFTHVPTNFWPKRENRIAYMKWLEKQLGYRVPEDWYRVTKSDFFDHHGGSLIQMGYKPVALIRELYPQRQWLQWRFIQVYQGYWNSREHRVEYLQWLGRRLGFKRMDDWLKLKRQDLVDNHGGGLVSEHYQGDVIRALQELFPKRRWYPWQLHKVPSGFWDDPANCRKYLRWLGRQLGFTKYTDWYRVKREHFRVHSGTGFLKRFKTPFRGLSAAYPNYRWLPWLFENVPVGFWEQPDNRGWYLRWVAQQLTLTQPEQWREVTTKQLREHRGNCLLVRMSLRQIRAEGERAKRHTKGSTKLPVAGSNGRGVLPVSVSSQAPGAGR